jgi:hypothetical protein
MPGKEQVMRKKQRVAEMANEVLARQARARAQRTGEPFEVALKAVGKTEAGRQLERSWARGRITTRERTTGRRRCLGSGPRSDTQSSKAERLSRVSGERAPHPGRGTHTEWDRGHAGSGTHTSENAYLLGGWVNKGKIRES